MAFDRQAAYQLYQQAFNANAAAIMGGGSVAPEYSAIIQQYSSPDAYVNAMEAQYNQQASAGGGTSPSAGTAGGSGGDGTTTSTGGFSGLTSGGTTTTTPTPVTQTAPTTNTGGPPPPTTTSTGGFSGLTSTNSQKLGPSAYQTLLGTYQTLYPGAQVSTPEGQQMFNQWVDGIRAQTGAATMEDIPITFSQGMPANYTQGGPGGPGTAVVPSGSNYQQNQNAQQSGGFSTTGGTTTTQQQQTGQQNVSSGTQQTQGTQQGTQTTAGTQQQTGGQTTTTGTTGTTTGTSTTAPTDALGFGSLLRNAATGAASKDANRDAFLTDVMQTGGTQFGSQVDQAVRNSLTGPQMTGAGDSARARASGYAAAEVGRNNLNQRLAAAQELTNPGSVAALASAAVPYGVGSSTTNTGTTAQQGTSTGTNFSNLTNNETVNNLVNSLSNTASNNTSNQTGFSNLTGTQNETQQGTATGNSQQSAAGVIPQAQTVNTGGGGCVLCTAAVELGLFNSLRVLRRVIEFKLRNKRFSSAARGYFSLFTPVAVYLLKRPRVARILYPLARAVVYEELRVSGRRLPRKEWASFVHWTGHAVCHLVGKLPVSGRVESAEIESIARKNNIWFAL